MQPCYELPGIKTTCGSHCWPFCYGSEFSDSYDYNHYMVMPELSSCYVDTVDYGKFNAYLSRDSLVNVTVDTFVQKNGICVRNETGVLLEPGSLNGNNYC